MLTIKTATLGIYLIGVVVVGVYQLVLLTALFNVSEEINNASKFKKVAYFGAGILFSIAIAISWPLLIFNL